MIPKRQRINCRFFLRVGKTDAWLKQAGTTDTGNGEGAPCAETTRWLLEAQGFNTRRQAERMREIISERYGLKAYIIEIKGGLRYAE